MFSEQYKLKPEAFLIARKKLILGALPMLAIMIFAFFIPYYSAKRNAADQQNLALVIALLLIFVTISMYRMLKKKKANYDNFVLTIDDNSISCTPLLREEINFSWIEITRIIKNPDGSFFIHGGADNKIITIPAQVENKEQLEEHLNSISPVIVTPKSLYTRYGKAFILTVTVLFLIFINSSGKIIVGITGPVLIAITAWSLFALKRNRQLNPATQRKLWWILLPIIGIIAKMLLILTNLFK